MNITLSLKGVSKALRQLGATAAVVLSTIESVPLPSSVRPVLAAAGAALLVAEHVLTGAKGVATGAVAPLTAPPAPAPVSGSHNAGPPAVG